MKKMIKGIEVGVGFVVILFLSVHLVEAQDTRSVRDLSQKERDEEIREFEQRLERVKRHSVNSPVAFADPKDSGKNPIPMLGLRSAGVAAKSNSPRNSSLKFDKQLARLEVFVERKVEQVNGELKLEELSILGVPSIKKGDVVKVKIVDLKGISRKWNLMVAFIKPIDELRKKEAIPNPVKLYKEENQNRVHFFKAPYDSHAIIFLVPDSRSGLFGRLKPSPRDMVYNVLKMNGGYDSIEKIGTSIVEISGQYSKLFSYVERIKDFKTNYVDENDADLKSMLKRTAETFGASLPKDWMTLGGTNPDAEWVDRFNYIIKNSDPSNFENVIREALDIKADDLLRAGIAKISNDFNKRFPSISSYVTLALEAIILMKQFFSASLSILPSLVKPDGNVASDPLLRIFPDRVRLYIDQNLGSENGVPFVPHRRNPKEVKNLNGIMASSDRCLSIGNNVFKNSSDNMKWAADTFTRDFKILFSSSDSNFEKEHALSKNLGLDAWNASFDENFIDSLSGKSDLKAQIVGKWGFDFISTSKFPVRVVRSQGWNIYKDSETQQATFVRDGKIKELMLVSPDGDCACVKSVIYRPKGKESEATALSIEDNEIAVSSDKRTATFSLDTSKIPIGKGNLEIRQFGEKEPKIIPLKLYDKPPSRLNFDIRVGDNYGKLTGERLEQITSIKVNGMETDISSLTKTGVIKLRNSLSEGSAKLDVVLEDKRPLLMFLPDEKDLTFTAKAKRLVLKPFVGQKFRATVDKPERYSFDLEKLDYLPLDAPGVTITIADADGKKVTKNQLENVSIRIAGQSLSYRLNRSNFKPGGDGELVIELPLNSAAALSGLEDPLSESLLNEQIQFQIVHKLRGETAWYTLSQKYVNLPKIESVTCSLEQDRGCLLEGKNLKRITSYSVNGEDFHKYEGGDTEGNILYLTRGTELLVKLRNTGDVPIPVVNYGYDLIQEISEEPSGSIPSESPEDPVKP